jgi:AraC-like DNA-binding protein
MISYWHVHAEDYTRQVLANPGTEIAAIWDEELARGKEKAAKYGVPYYESLDDMLEKGGIDAVVVDAPTNIHREVMVKAAQAGKHIFTEKVVAATYQEVRDIHAAVRDAGVKLTVSLPRLFQQSDSEDPMHELCLHIEFIPLKPIDGGAEGVWGTKLECSEAEACIGVLNSVPKTIVWDTYNAMGGFLDAYRAWEEQPPGFYTLLKQAVIQILLRSTRMFGAAGPEPGIPERDMNGHRYELATQYIQDNESRPISLEEVAERVNISSRQLQRIFQSEGRTTFRDYLEYVRLSAVCADLLNTGRSIEEVALAHGYATPTHLFPVFKQKYGMTPAAYRRMQDGGATPDTL